MKILHIVLVFLALIFLNRCSNTRFLADDQLLYTGRKQIEVNDVQRSEDKGEVKSYVKSVTRSKPNNSILGLRVLPPVSLWIYNYLKPEKEKGLGNWFYKTFSKPPVLITDVNPELRTAKIQNDLNNRGYFHSTASSAIHPKKYNPKKGSVSYSVKLYPPWTISRVFFDSVLLISDSIAEAGLSDLVKTGDRFDLSDIKSAQAIIAQNLQENGYFFFIPDYVAVYADSGIGGREIDLSFGMKDNLNANVLSRYRVNNITIRLTREGATDSILSDTVQFKEVRIISDGTIIKPGILYNCINFSPGDFYSVSAYRKTLGNLNDLNVFRLVNMTFNVPRNDSASRMLDALVEIYVPNSVSLSFESDLVTKSTGYTGPAMIAGIRHNNTFKGAEKLELKLRGNIEWQWYKDFSGELGSFSYEAGANSSFVFPRIIVIKGLFNTRKLVTSSTSLNGGFNLLNRTAFYRLSSFRAGMSYQWGNSQRIRHTLHPLYLNSVKLLKTTATFDSIISSNIYIKRSFEEQFILGPRYEFLLDTKTPDNKSHFYFIGGVYTSGNLVSLISDLAIAQFAKFTADLRYYLNFGDQTLVTRVYAGIGLPYGKSSVLPYVEQFFSGGAYSVRGFPARRLGPGSVFERYRGYIDQSGDIKLEMNVEYRIKLSKLLHGALFLETGNVWLRNNDPERSGAQFRGDTFLNQMAVGTGFGLRFDLGFFVLRTDVGMPLRTPYTQNGSHCIGRFRDIIQNSVFHLAIGYPF